MKKLVLSLARVAFIIAILFSTTTIVNAQGPGGLIDGGGTGDDTTMPVKKITLTADRSNEVINLSWTTVGESQMLSFTVEKSFTGNSFSAFYTVVAKNTQIASYSTSDASNAASYYRIKAIDTKGIVNYSDVKHISANSNVKINAYPNPLVGNLVHLATSNLSASKYMVRLFNNIGQNVFTSAIDGANNIYNLNLGLQPSGFYHLTVSTGNMIVYNSALQIK